MCDELNKSQVKKAGRNIRKGIGDLEAAKKVIQNFRAAHAIPMTSIELLVSEHLKMLGIRKDAILVTRLKRLPTIISKLTRPSLDGGLSQNAIDITRMQDIGGCRVIVQNKADLLKLNQSLDEADTFHEVKTTEYLQQARDTGYRGIHKIFNYKNKVLNDPNRNLRIELQIRTHKQNVWATGVEVIDILKQTTLKTEPLSACPKWKQFFVLLSEYIAIIDGFVPKEQVSKELAERYRNSFHELAEELELPAILKGFNRGISLADKEALRNSKYLLIRWCQSSTNQDGHLEWFSNEQQAFQRYAEAEAETDVDALLIATNDLNMLSEAYPNYLGDTSEFLRLAFEATFAWPSNDE